MLSLRHSFGKPHRPQRTPYGIAVAMLLIISAALLGCGGTGAAPEAGADATSEIPTEGVFLGSPEAPVLIRDFSDFSCSHCRDASRSLLPPVIENYVRSGQVRIEFIPVAIVDPNGSAYAAMAALCAADQGQLWPYQEKLFANQGQIRYDPNGLVGISDGMGMDKNAFQNCIASQKYLRQVDANNQEFQRVGGQGTPYFLVNDQPVAGAVAFEEMKAVIDAQLDAAK